MGNRPSPSYFLKDTPKTISKRRMNRLPGGPSQDLKVFTTHGRGQIQKDVILQKAQ